MGYCTNFSLGVHKGDTSIEEVMLQSEDFEGLNYAVDNYGDPCDPVKWYSHEKDMKELSTRFPNEVFVLHGEGEESGDVWYKYFKNGKMQECYAKITFEDYDENKLR